MSATSDLSQSPLLGLLEAAAAGARYVIVALGADRRILTLLPAKDLLGYPAAELVGRNITEVLGVAKLREGTRFLRDRSGALSSVRISRVALPAGLGGLVHPEARILLVIAEVPEAGLLLAAVDRETSGEPLADANRSLQQASELRQLVAVMEERSREVTEELRLAADVQKSIVPTTFPSHLPLAFAHKYLPYAYIGGDFFDVVQLDEDHLGIIIADVSGHGVPAAFITTMLKGAFAACASRSSAATLHALNRTFCESIHTDHYITAFYTVLQMSTLQMTYSSAGHPKQLLVRASGECDELSTDGFFIGMFESTAYGEAVTQLAVGDRILYYTDGILEVEGSTGEQFGRQNLRRVAEANRVQDVDTLSAFVIDDLITHMAQDTFQDDITLLIAEVVERGEAAAPPTSSPR